MLILTYLCFFVLLRSTTNGEKNQWITRKLTNTQYYFSDIKSGWETANVTCAALGGHIVSINTAEENEFLLENNPNIERFWIGLNRNYSWSSWIWQDDTAVKYTNWAREYPQQAELAEHCGLEYYKYLGHSTFRSRSWQNDARFSSYRFVCEIDDACKSRNGCREDETCVADYRGGFICEDTVKPTTDNPTTISYTTSKSKQFHYNNTGHNNRFTAVALPILVTFVCLCLIAVVIMVILAFRMLISKRIPNADNYNAEETLILTDQSNSSDSAQCHSIVVTEPSSRSVQESVLSIPQHRSTNTVSNSEHESHQTCHSSVHDPD